MQILINLSNEEIENLKSITNIRDEHDIRCAIHELIQKQEITKEQ